MLYLSKEDAELIGLEAVISQCRCRSPQGNRLKAFRHFYKPAEKAELEAEYSSIDALTQLLKAKDPQIISASRQLAQLRELRATFSGLESERLLDETELFELKKAISVFNQLAALKDLLEQAQVVIHALPDAARLLDPAGLGSPGFYIYTEYSERLRVLRKNKRKLEAAISKAEGAKRKELLDERNFLSAEENQEEERVRRELGIRLLPLAETLKANAEACGLLDFRLARAELALHWGAAKPVVTEQSEPAKLTGAWHPVVAARLQKLGGVFTRQSLELRQGATVITGANMGGKSVAMQTSMLCLTLAQLGYFSPCEALETPLYEFISYAADISAAQALGLSSFGNEAVRLRDDYKRAKKKRGLVLMDEPCRGTNPGEARAILQSLCEAYAASPSTLLIASHYPIKPAEGIHYYQIRGIDQAALEAQSPKVEGLEDEKLIKRLHSLMDFRLQKVDGQKKIPSAAIKVAELLGMDRELLLAMQKNWQEDEWQNLD